MTKDELEVALKAAQARGDELEVALNTATAYNKQVEGALEAATEQLDAATETIRRLEAVAPVAPEVTKAGAEFPKMIYFQGDPKKYIIVKSASEEEQAGEDWWDALAS